MNVNTILNNILNYIVQNYDVEAEIKPDCLCKDNIYVKTKKYDLNINVKKPGKHHFLYNKSEYCLSFDYEANKKYRTELCWHNGGYDSKYNENDYTNIDDFLKDFCDKKLFREMTIFDFEEA